MERLVFFLALETFLFGTAMMSTSLTELVLSCRAAFLIFQGGGRSAFDYNCRSFRLNPIRTRDRALCSLRGKEAGTELKELGATDDDIKSAIFDSVKLSVDSFKGNADLVEMKGE